MSREAFRVFLAFVIVAFLVVGSLVAWHFTHQHQVCDFRGCHTVYG